MDKIPDKLYREFLKWMPRPCTDIVVIADGHALLLKRAINPLKGYWALPGGLIELGESAELAAIRKLRQEVELVTLPSELSLCTVATYFHSERQDVCATYSLHLRERFSVHCDSQHIAVGWFDPSQLPEPMHEVTVAQVKAAFLGGDA